MNAKTVIMDFSGVYKEENFYQGKDAQWLDFTKMTGVNCYCTEEAEEEIKERIKNLDFSGIHFLDSGNYHYLSKYWTEKIDRPFLLVVFDNHTDMQEASFWGLLSCGSWVRECILSNKYIKEVCVIGPPRTAFLECEKEILEKVTPISREDMKQEKSQWHEFLERNQDVPVYLSLDKDILSLEAARTNWDQNKRVAARIIFAMLCIGSGCVRRAYAGYNISFLSGRYRKEQCNQQKNLGAIGKKAYRAGRASAGQGIFRNKTGR